MAAMDLRTNQEVMGVQRRYSTEYGSHTIKMKETYEEDDFKGNNNFYDSLKTEANGNHGHDPGSLFQVNGPNGRDLEVENSLFSYSSFKKAMDLRTHTRTLDGGKRTIFDDAEHFARNHCYKLLPITFEQVDETIIQSEHNYSLFSVTSESEPEEDCSRMMDYSQIREKNYKRRRTKFREGSDEEEAAAAGETAGVEEQSQKVEEEEADVSENPAGGVQPLDLSATPGTDDEKTDTCLRERPNGSPEKNDREKMSEKGNAEPNGIRVTITRPDEKENYQPCDLFLNDIARLVPWLIDKDCLEVDILDRTCDRHEELRKHRLYYVIAESTWRLFQGTNERVILTNDQSLGQPLRKAEKEEKPSYLVFDQFSLAKCLAEHCQEIGGCFEYTCVEEGKETDEGATAKKADAAEKPGETETEEEESAESTNEVREVAREREEVEQPGEEREKEKKQVEPPTEEEIPEKPQEEKESEVEKARLNPGRARKKKKSPAKQPKPKVKPPRGEAIPKSDRMTTRSKSTSESETSQTSDKRVRNGRGGRTGKRRGSTPAEGERPSKIKKRTPEREPESRKKRSGKTRRESAGTKETDKGKEAEKRTTRCLRSRKNGTEREKTGTSSKPKGGQEAIKKRGRT